MNLPNKLTIFRVILIPFFIIALLVPGIPAGNWIALAIFIVASLTDLLDGKIARKYNLVTNFGKFMDPLADKLLVCSALICLVELSRIPSWMVVIIIAREFTISGFRLIAADNGVVILPDDCSLPYDCKHSGPQPFDHCHHMDCGYSYSGISCRLSGQE